MSKLRKLKAEQIAEAEKAGKPNPYAAGSIGPTTRQTRISKLKPLIVGFDEASGPGESVVVDLSNLTDEQKKALQNGMPPGLVVVTEPLQFGSADRLFEQLKAAMAVDVQRLSDIKVMDEKIAVKRERLADYLPFVMDYINQGHNYPNSVAVQVTIWLFDIGDIEKALHVGLYLVRTPKQFMPERFSSDLPTFICDYTYDWANAELKEKRSASPYLDNVVKVMMDAKWQLSVPVESKMFNMMAKHADLKGDYASVIGWSDKAEAINPEGHGTKTLKAKAQKALEKTEQE